MRRFAGHYIETCICGRMLSQCRCPGPKTKYVRSPCACPKPKEAMPKDPAAEIVARWFKDPEDGPDAIACAAEIRNALEEARWQARQEAEEELLRDTYHLNEKAIRQSQRLEEQRGRQTIWVICPRGDGKVIAHSVIEARVFDTMNDAITELHRRQR